jgi:hypothetical protein
VRRSFISALLVLVALAATIASGATASRSITKICVISATGALGGNANGNITTGAGTAGGLAQKDGAKAALAIVCNFLSNGVKITIPSHTVNMKTFVHGLPGACTVSGTTVSCKLSTALQKQGLNYGGWKDTFAWKFTPGDAASKNTVDGSCHIPMTVTLTNNNAVTYTKKTATVCEFALGDVLR